MLFTKGGGSVTFPFVSCKSPMQPFSQGGYDAAIAFVSNKLHLVTDHNSISATPPMCRSAVSEHVNICPKLKPTYLSRPNDAACVSLSRLFNGSTSHGSTKRYRISSILGSVFLSLNVSRATSTRSITRNFSIVFNRFIADSSVSSIPDDIIQRIAS